MPYHARYVRRVQIITTLFFSLFWPTPTTANRENRRKPANRRPSNIYIYSIVPSKRIGWPCIVPLSTKVIWCIGRHYSIHRNWDDNSGLSFVLLWFSEFIWSCLLFELGSLRTADAKDMCLYAASNPFRSMGFSIRFSVSVVNKSGANVVWRRHLILPIATAHILSRRDGL